MELVLDEPYKSKYKSAILRNTRGVFRTKRLVTLINSKDDVICTTISDYQKGVFSNELVLSEGDINAIKIKCTRCNQHFFIHKSEENDGKIKYCSKTCNGKSNTENTKLQVSPEVIAEIKRLKALGMRTGFIVKQTGASRNTVLKYVRERDMKPSPDQVLKPGQKYVMGEYKRWETWNGMLESGRIGEDFAKHRFHVLTTENEFWIVHTKRNDTKRVEQMLIEFGVEAKEIRLQVPQTA